jgi:outer membrane lipoprotein
MVLENPDAYKGRTVILGGIIIETVNVKDGTEIVVLDTPLDFMEKPKTATYSRGRFIAKDLKFLDPAVYKPDRYVTLAGEVEGVEERDLGKTTYMYPVVVIREIYLWESRNHRYNPYYYYWYDPWYGPGPYYYYVPYYRYSYPYRDHYRNYRHHR